MNLKSIQTIADVAGLPGAFLTGSRYFRPETVDNQTDWDFAVQEGPEVWSLIQKHGAQRIPTEKYKIFNQWAADIYRIRLLDEGADSPHIDIQIRTQEEHEIHRTVCSDFKEAGVTDPSPELFNAAWSIYFDAWNDCNNQQVIRNRRTK